MEEIKHNSLSDYAFYLFHKGSLTPFCDKEIWHTIPTDWNSFEQAALVLFLVIHLLFGMKSRSESFQFLLLLFVLSQYSEMIWQVYPKQLRMAMFYIFHKDKSSVFNLTGRDPFHTQRIQERTTQRVIDWENNSWNSNLPSFILDVDFECQCRLNPAGQRAKPKSQGSSDIMSFFIICELRDEQTMTLEPIPENTHRPMEHMKENETGREMFRVG